MIKLIITKIILFILFSAVSINAQLEQRQMNFLQKLIADGTNIPITSGKLYKHNHKIKFKEVADFEKKLTDFKINFNNKITILVFWERSDRYSKILLPHLEHIKNNYKYVQIYSINSNDFNDKNGLIAFLNNYNNTECLYDLETNQYYEEYNKKYFKPLTIPILFTPEKIKQQYGIEAFPTTIVVDKKGKVYTGMVGFFAEYEKWISEVLDGLK